MTAKPKESFSGKRFDRLLPHLRTAGLEPMPATCSPEEFMIEKAMVHWCRAVEDALGRLSWVEIPEQARQRFALLGIQEVHRAI